MDQSPQVMVDRCEKYYDFRFFFFFHIKLVSGIETGLAYFLILLLLLLLFCLLYIQFFFLIVKKTNNFIHESFIMEDHPSKLPFSVCYHRLLRLKGWLYLVTMLL